MYIYIYIASIVTPHYDETVMNSSGIPNVLLSVSLVYFAHSFCLCFETS